MIPVIAQAALGAGEMTVISVAGEEVLVANVDGQFYAVSNLCSHAGARLSSGRLNGHELSCPMHRAVFDVRTGIPVKAPAAEQLKRYPLVLENGKVNILVDGQ